AGSASASIQVKGSRAPAAERSTRASSRGRWLRGAMRTDLCCMGRPSEDERIIEIERGVPAGRGGRRDQLVECEELLPHLRGEVDGQRSGRDLGAVLHVREDLRVVALARAGEEALVEHLG